MMDSFFEYKNQIIQTGDAVKCIYNGHNISKYPTDKSVGF
jgi:hypothetical protein